MSDTGILVLVIALVLLFGASQIPKLARNIAAAGKEFRKVNDEDDVTTTPPVVAAPSAASPATQGRPAQEAVILTRSQLDALVTDRAAHASSES